MNIFVHIFWSDRSAIFPLGHYTRGKQFGNKIYKIRSKEKGTGENKLFCTINESTLQGGQLWGFHRITSNIKKDK